MAREGYRLWFGKCNDFNLHGAFSRDRSIRWIFVNWIPICSLGTKTVVPRSLWRNYMIVPEFGFTAISCCRHPISRSDGRVPEELTTPIKAPPLASKQRGIHAGADW